MRISTISPRFGHQLTTFVFLRLVFAEDVKNSFFSRKRLLVSVVIGLVCSWVGVAGWDFPPYLRGLVINLQCFVSTMPVYAADIRNNILLSRLLDSVDIGLVCSWVGVAGWDFPPYLRGLVINLQLLFFQGSSLQEISQTVYFFPLDCQSASFLVSSAPALASQDEIFQNICAVWSSVATFFFFNPRFCRRH